MLLTIPTEFREYFGGRKQLKKSTGTSDLADAKRRQHNISAELYAQLYACKPDPRDVISDLLGWIGDAEVVQRMEEALDLAGTLPDRGGAVATIMLYLRAGVEKTAFTAMQRAMIGLPAE